MMNRPEWREELDELTGVSLKECLDCFDTLWNVFLEKYPTSSKEKQEKSPQNVTAI